MKMGRIARATLELREHGACWVAALVGLVLWLSASAHGALL
jgi:hypothetical protein